MQASQPVDFSIVIPSYNEGQRLPAFLRALVQELSFHNLKGEVIVADDGSRAQDRAIYEQLIKDIGQPQVRLSTSLVNEGKGAAICRGFREAKGRWIGFVDADGATSSAEVVRLLKQALASTQVSGVFGSRVRMLGYAVDRTLSRHLTGRLFVTLVHNLLHVPMYDSQCGCKFFVKKDLESVLPLCQEKGFLIDVEILAIGWHKGLKFLEVPINWSDVPGSKVNVLLDGIKMFQGLWRIRRRMLAAGLFKG